MHNYQTISNPSTSRRQKCTILEEKESSPLAKLSVLAPVLIISTITLASLFYKFYHNWEMSTCIYYACQTLIGVMYGVPEEKDRYSQIFSLLLYFLGATYIYAAIAAYADIITERAVALSKDVARMDNVIDLDGDGVISCSEWMTYFHSRLFSILNWNENKYAIVTIGISVAWLVLGIVYGLFFEGYDLYTSVYFALGAMMLAGSVAPPCVGDPSNCSLGTPRALFMSIYLIVGSPMFILTMGQFYEALITKAQTARQRAKYLRRFTPDEFEYAADMLRSTSVHGHSSKSVNFSEFVVLELMRTEVVNSAEIEHLRRVFTAIDADDSGRITYSEIKAMHS